MKKTSTVYLISILIIACTNGPKAESIAKEKIHAKDTIASLKTDSVETPEAESKDDFDDYNNELIKIDTIRIKNKKEHWIAEYHKYTLRGNSLSVQLFNKALRKKYKEITEFLSFTECDPEHPCDASMTNNIKLLTENAFSIVIDCWQYGGGVHGEGWSYFKNYIIKDNQLEELEFKDLFKPDIDLKTLNYVLETDNFFIGKPDELEGTYLNFGTYPLQPGDYGYLEIDFSFTKKGILLQFQFQRYPEYELDEKFIDKIITYEKLKPYMKPDIYNLLKTDKKQ